MDRLDEHLDACIKCSACTAQCPVAAVYPLFPGPKSAGPDAERLRLEDIAIDPDCLSYCTNCKTCEVTCPSGVRITEMILRARRQGRRKKRRLELRDSLLGRAEYLGRVGSLWPVLTNTVLGWNFTRELLEKMMGISARAPLPNYTRKFRVEHTPPKKKETRDPLDPRDPSRPGKQVVYFPGCFVTYNDEATGQAVVKVLEHQGYEVIVPAFHCCGVPLTANGFFAEAEANARQNLGLMQPFLDRGIPVLTSCPSCGLALKENYPRLSVHGVERIGVQTYDLFEFLWNLHEAGELKEDFQTVEVNLAYHAPCHLKAQGIGTPVLRILRTIPGLKVEELDAGCCGLSGSFGFKEEKYVLGLEIGGTLFSRIQEGRKEEAFQSVVTECGGCQVQIEHGSGTSTQNPVWILLEAYGLHPVSLLHFRPTMDRIPLSPLDFRDSSWYDMENEDVGVENAKHPTAGSRPGTGEPLPNSSGKSHRYQRVFESYCGKAVAPEGNGNRIGNGCKGGVSWMPVPQSGRKYTYADYLTWPEGERWEIIEGVPYMQSAPSWEHQAISVELASQFNVQLKEKPCRVFAAPFDVCIPEHDEIDEEISNIIAQPDIVVVCDQSKLRKTGYFGVPELIIEISSPSTAKNDKLLKFNRFEKAGVKEYWIVEAENKLVSVYVLQDNKRYGRPEVYTAEDTVKVSIIPELEIDLSSVLVS